jgi:hypothetical protein
MKTTLVALVAFITKMSQMGSPLFAYYLKNKVIRLGCGGRFYHKALPYAGDAALSGLTKQLRIKNYELRIKNQSVNQLIS